MQVCTSLQTDNHASIPPLCFFTGRMPFLPPNQQCQSTEGMSSKRYHKSAVYWTKYSTQQHQTWFLGASAAGGNKCLFVAVHVHFLQLLTNHLRALINQHAFTPVNCGLQTDIFKIKKLPKSFEQAERSQSGQINSA